MNIFFIIFLLSFLSLYGGEKKEILPFLREKLGNNPALRKELLNNTAALNAAVTVDLLRIKLSNGKHLITNVELKKEKIANSKIKLSQKIKQHLQTFTKSQSLESEKFLFVAQKNKYLTPEQDQLFTEILKQKQETNKCYFAHQKTTTTTYYQIILLILLLLVNQVG